MKNYKKVIIYTVVFILFMILAVWGYNYLKEEYPEGETGENSKEEVLVKASDFKMLNSKGEEVKLSDFYGKPVIVNFWETWCSPCKMELPSFNKLYLQYGDKINFVMVNLTDGYKGDTGAVKDFVSSNKYDFPLYFDIDSSAAIAYSIYSIPQTLFIDENGNIVKSVIGMMSEETLSNYINELLK